MGTVHRIKTKPQKIFLPTSTKFEILEKLRALKNEINCKHFNIKLVVFYQVSKEIESKILV